LYKPNYICSINTRHTTNLHPHVSELTTFQKEASYFGIKIFIHLQTRLHVSSNELEQFRPALKQFLLTNWFSWLH